MNRLDSIFSKTPSNEKEQVYRIGNCDFQQYFTKVTVSSILDKVALLDYRKEFIFFLLSFFLCSSLSLFITDILNRYISQGFYRRNFCYNVLQEGFHYLTISTTGQSIETLIAVWEIILRFKHIHWGATS